MSAARSRLQRFAWLSVATAVGTISLKTVAWQWTGSVGLLADALESIVNLAAALATVGAIIVAARPPDDDHAYGHDKVEFFASGFEGALILTAALGIFIAAIHRVVEPAPLSGLTFGLVVSALASALNLITARILLRAGQRHRSPALSADGHHLMTDVWSSCGVLLGVGLVALTGWTWLDPLIAFAVGAYIVGMGIHLVKESIHGLLDRALPASDLKAIDDVLETYRLLGLQFHALRTRSAGSRQFVSMHVLVPDDWTVRRGHDVVEQIECDLRALLPASILFTHLEPLNDPRSWEDEHLDARRPDLGPS